MNSKTIAVIDYGMGNLHSAAKALEHVAPNDRVIVTHDKEQILAADRVVFPGVGAIRDCMAEIRRLELDKVIQEVASTRPLLAICVAMQCLMDSSEENGGVECLSMLPGQVKFFGSDLHETNAEGASQRLKVPHMGWNQLTQKMDHPVWHDIPDLARFYFVHSYYVELDQPELCAGETVYGKRFVASIAKENIMAVQFHPEKSQHHGLQLLKNFAQWDGGVS
ncbi:MAG: imidazole glycerol phosphate synthase subunit HisH [Gammaproteobacteria bacterium]|nr:MAG: imidazole glycerol phosphate synthase subunit HisH [Gammaproteobacteria bacterium]